MATGNYIVHEGAHTITLTASGAITAGDLVEMSNDETVKKYAGSNANRVIGVAFDTVADGEPVAVMVRGVALFKAAGAIAAGALVKASDSEDEVADYVEGTDTEDKILGYALSKSTGQVSTRTFKVYINK